MPLQATLEQEMCHGAKQGTTDQQGSEGGSPCGTHCALNLGLPDLELLQSSRWRRGGDQVPLALGWLLQDNASCLRPLPNRELLVELHRAILVKVILTQRLVLAVFHLDCEQRPGVFHTVQADKDSVLRHRSPPLVVGCLVSWLTVPNHRRVKLDLCLDRFLLVQTLNLTEASEFFEAAGMRLMMLHVELHDLIHRNHRLLGIAVPPQLHLHRRPPRTNRCLELGMWHLHVLRIAQTPPKAEDRTLVVHLVPPVAELEPFCVVVRILIDCD
mmetsp:Transcript_63309/g.160275  ORF Transcript_63309/g.160275 Transcript_63309/m.160275 type:complete len:271 (-) Transcript_63309:1759-2571(-)